MITHHLFRWSFNIQLWSRIGTVNQLGRARLRRALIKPCDPRPTEEVFPESLRWAEVIGLPSFRFWLRVVARRIFGFDGVSPYLQGCALLSVLTALAASGASADAAPQFSAELIFPLHHQHNHAPAIVECPNGDLLVSWYRGSGERKADDVAVYGARRPRKQTHWSEPFLMVDTPGFPDGNTAMFIDSRQRLWLFWPIILANSWESCITSYRVSINYELEGRAPRVPDKRRDRDSWSSSLQGTGSPKWDWQGQVLLKPEGFAEDMEKALEARLKSSAVPAEMTNRLTEFKHTITNKLSQRLGWQPRCKPTVLRSGRIVLPLYSDTYSVSIMALSDDAGQTWFASRVLAGFGNIQPAVLQRKDGSLVAYMRENGPLDHIRVADSRDDGMTWGPVGTMDLPNPGSGLDALRLANGHWLLIYNDTT